jgi:hypothetical protein
VFYLLVLVFIAWLLWLSLKERSKDIWLKKNGVRVSGIIIENKEEMAESYWRLGGNINQPTVKFITRDGREIIGTPILGFITQHEVAPPIWVTVFYDPNHPEKFTVDFN